MPSWKDDVRAATTGNIAPFPSTALLAIDGVGLQAGDRVLVKDQADGAQNGIWTAAAGVAWTRSADANTSALVTPETTVRVSEGDDNAHTEWTLTTQAPITINTTDLVFTQTNPLTLFYGETHYSGSAMSDADIFKITNDLADGQSSNPQAYLAASLAGYGGICTGVHGRNGDGSSQLPDLGVGVYGDSDNGYGVWGACAASTGVYGTSQGSDGVKGVSAASSHAGVSAVNDSGGYGLWARGTPAVYGTSATTDAIVGTSGSPQHAGVSANNTSRQTGDVPSGFALWASSNNTAVFARGAPAGYFDGDVQITGDVVLINSVGADVAEDFDMEDEAVDADPGTVLVIGAEGRLLACDEAYDTRVAGVIFGAGELRPAVVLQRIQAKLRRSPIALVGKVYCKVDAEFGAIAAGDLLTTSTTSGHAMKVADRARAVGTILGKALRSHSVGRGLIPILVSPR